MTVGRYTGQTKAGISNHNLQHQRDVCVYVLMLKMGTQNHLALYFKTIMSDKIYLERDLQIGVSFLMCIISETF